MKDRHVSVLVYSTSEKTKLSLDKILSQTKFQLFHETQHENFQTYLEHFPDLVIVDMAKSISIVEKLINFLKTQSTPFLIIEKERPMRPLETVIKEKRSATIGHPIINAKLQEALDYLVKLIRPIEIIFENPYVTKIQGDGEIARASESIIEVKSGMSIPLDHTIKLQGDFLNQGELSFVRAVKDSRYDSSSGMFINTLYLPNSKDNLVTKVSVLKR